MEIDSVAMGIVTAPDEAPQEPGLYSRSGRRIPFSRAFVYPPDNGFMPLETQFLQYAGDEMAVNGGYERLWALHDRLVALDPRWGLDLITPKMAFTFIPLLLHMSHNNGVVVYANHLKEQFLGAITLYRDEEKTGMSRKFTDVHRDGLDPVPFVVKTNPSETVFTIVPFSDIVNSCTHVRYAQRRINLRFVTRVRKKRFATPVIAGKHEVLGRLIIRSNSRAGERLRLIQTGL